MKRQMTGSTLELFKQSHLDQLRSDDSVERIEECITQVQWVNGFTGEEHTYYIDLTIIKKDGTIEHIDFAVDAFPLTKYLYAQNQLDNWKLVTVNPAPFKW